MEERDMRERDMRDGRNPYGSRGGYVTSSRPSRGRGGRGRGRRGDRGMDYADYDMREREMMDRRGEDYGDYARGGRGSRGGRVSYQGGQGGRGRGDRGDYAEYDMRDGHHMMREGGSTYYPIQAMGTFEGYYGTPESDYDMRGGYGRRDYRYDYEDYGDYGDYGETLSEKELEHWCKKLKDQLDEREKQMFSEEQIKQRAKQIGRKMDGFGEKELEVATLMIYTDYKKTIGQNIDLAIKLAFDWLTDEDVAVKGAEKLAVYYDCIVEGE